MPDKGSRMEGKKRTNLYPRLSDLEDSGASDLSESIVDDDDAESLCESLQRVKVRKKKKEKEKCKQEKERKCEPECYSTPSAPPPYSGVTTPATGVYFNPDVWREVRTEMHVAFPVFQNP
ncbi:hypothetical protein STEG23_001513 [Scotinomys teguina]